MPPSPFHSGGKGLVHLHEDGTVAGRITVCATCARGTKADAPRADTKRADTKRADATGAHLADRLREALTRDRAHWVADCLGEARFEICEAACMAGCERPCTVAYQAAGKTSYLFGGIDPVADLRPLLQFAAQYAASADGWTREAERPAGLRGKILARLPTLPALPASIGRSAP